MQYYLSEIILTHQRVTDIKTSNPVCLVKKIATKIINFIQMCAGCCSQMLWGHKSTNKKRIWAFHITLSLASKASKIPTGARFVIGYTTFYRQ